MNQKTLNVILIVVLVILLSMVIFLCVDREKGEKNDQDNVKNNVQNIDDNKKVDDQNKNNDIVKDNVVDQNTNNFVNAIYNISFFVPDNYNVGSNSYGVTEASKADRFFFRKQSDNYTDVPILDVSANLKLSSNQTFYDLVNSIYTINKTKKFAVSEIKATNYDGKNAYEFTLQKGYEDTNGGGLFGNSEGRVVFIYHNGKVFQFLQTGTDPGLDSILNSIKF